MKKNIGLWVVGFALWAMCFGLCALGFAQETITLTTYYPSPFGSYNELTVASRMAVGDVNQDLAVDVNDLGNIGFAPAGDPTGVLTVGRMLSVGPLANPVTPQAMFHVQGRTTANDAAIFMPGAGRTMRVGIGTANPTADLSFGTVSSGLIANDIRTIRVEGRDRNDSVTSGTHLYIQAGAAHPIFSDSQAGFLYLNSGASTGNAASTIYFSTATPSSGTTINNPSRKMTILGNGNVGIGTQNPLNSLHIDSVGTSGNVIPAIRIVDGNQLAGRVLTSDANGVGSWQPPPTSRVIWGVVNANGTIASGDGFTVSKVGTGIYKITFTPAFSKSPSVAISVTVDTDRFCVAGLASKDSVEVKINQYAVGFADTQFNFVVAGDW